MICNKCKQDKEEENFSFKNKEKGIKHKQCKVCSRENNKSHYNRNKSYYRSRNNKQKKLVRSYLDDLKANSSCKICGENHPGCLQFHHRNPKEKDFVIALKRTTGIAISTLKKEIDKCDILCANCHSKLHWEERNKI